MIIKKDHCGVWTIGKVGFEMFVPSDENFKLLGRGASFDYMASLKNYNLNVDVRIEKKEKNTNVNGYFAKDVYGYYCFRVIDSDLQPTKEIFYFKNLFPIANIHDTELFKPVNRMKNNVIAISKKDYNDYNIDWILCPMLVQQKKVMEK